MQHKKTSRNWTHFLVKKMDKHAYESYVKAGKILAQVREYAKTLIKDGVKYLDVVEKLDKKIIELGGTHACPVTISINEIAAHDTAMPGDTRVFKTEDIVKIDFGIHVDGYPADGGTTIEIGTKKHENLIKASSEALEEAIKILKPGLEIKEIGKKVNEIMSKYGFNAVTNLSGHSVERYNLHSGITIPNYDNNSKQKLEKGMVMTIEPFATSGAGRVNSRGVNKIYRLVERKPVRISFVKDILNFIEKNYNTLPFAVKWLDDAGLKNYQYALNILEREGIVHGYKPLIDNSKKLVSYKEHTMIIDDEVTITTL